jgi:hypothetical protein
MIFLLFLLVQLELSPTDYIEVFAERYSGSGNITVSLNLIINSERFF